MSSKREILTECIQGKAGKFLILEYSFLTRIGRYIQKGPGIRGNGRNIAAGALKILQRRWVSGFLKSEYPYYT